MQRIVVVIREQGAGTARGWDWAGLRSRCLREARRVLPGAEAEEAVQEALIRAWTRRHACRTPDAPLPWMLQITRNEARRLLQRRARRLRQARAEPTSEEEDDPVAGATTRVTVEQALARLEDADRRVLRLRYRDDLTQAEVARRLGVPEGTVKVRLHRARGRLRTLLEDYA
jgi:RNA polymerase sigma-70 factor (ECF subfamily)